MVYMTAPPLLRLRYHRITDNGITSDSDTRTRRGAAVSLLFC